MTDANQPNRHDPNTQDGSARIRDLIALTDELSGVFSKENALLIAQRPGSIAPLQVEKSRLATAYAVAIREIATDRYLVEGADDTLLATLREMTQRFNALANDQRNLLAGANHATHAIVQAVAQEAANPAHQRSVRQGTSHRPMAIAPGYSSKARMSTKNIAAPISVNERA